MWRSFHFLWEIRLQWARMESGVLGNALERVRVEEEEGEKTENGSLVENNNNIGDVAREELKEQVYDAMGKKDAKNPRKTSFW